MEKHFDNPRTIRRLAPKHAATAAVFQDAHQLAYGVLTNVSATGACIATDSRIKPGESVDLRLSFYREEELVEVTARVVWNRQGGSKEKGFEGLQLHGVEFVQTSAVTKSRLHTLLAGDEFVNVYRPTTTEFDVLQSALSGELDQLGSKMHKTTGDAS